MWCIMSASKVLFEGIIVGFEKLSDGADALYVQGSINGESAFFYLVVPRDKFEEYVNLGVGQMINGEGVIVSRDPLVIKIIGDEA